jgi:alkyl hydroperoxide reductase subunit AhpF
MAFLQDADREQVQQRLEAELQEPVKMLLFSEPVSSLYLPGIRQCVSCRETEQLLQEVTDLSDLIELEIVNVKESPALASEWSITSTPTIAFLIPEDTGIRIMGLPSGYEFVSFLETLISVSRGAGYGLTAETIALLESLEDEVDIKVFSTPT